MNQDKYYNNCEKYNTSECPHINDKLMKIFVADIVDKHMTGEVINKLFCNTCTTFKNRRS